MYNHSWTLQQLFGITCADIEDLYVVFNEDLDETRYKVTTISVVDFDKFRIHRQYPMFLLCSYLELKLDTPHNSEDTIKLTFNDLLSHINSSILEVMFDTDKITSLTIKI